MYLILFIGLGTLLLTLWSCRAPQLGVREGALLPCPERPNCVCSQQPDSDHGTRSANWIEPLPAPEPDAAWRKLREILEARPRTEILTDASGADDAAVDGYMRVVTKSLVCRFRDDLEFLLDRDGRCIHVRSASRVGAYDLGANRRRVDEIRAQLAAP